MKQDPESRYFFTVQDGEAVRITFNANPVPNTPLRDAERVFAVAKDTQLAKQVNAGKRAVTFAFTVDRPKTKSHGVSFECVFFSISDPVGAKYSITVSSDQTNGNSFTVPAANRLKPTGTLWFTVA